jgi:hypothetical protein
METFDMLMAENIPKIMIDFKLQILEAHRMRSKKNTKKEKEEEYRRKRNLGI